MVMILLAVFILQYADGHRDADAYVIASGVYEDCVKFGLERAGAATKADSETQVVFSCQFEIDHFVAPTPPAEPMPDETDKDRA